MGVANLEISAVCNQNCAYCFTADHRQPGRDFLPLSAFGQRLDFLARSGIDEARLLGGEPSLHPHFAELVERAKAASKRVVIFSNGLMPETALACLEALPVEQCTVMVNVNQPSAGDDGAHRQRREVMRRLGARALPGFTIYRPDFQPEFLLPLIAETGSKPVIRLGMAQPCLSGSNRYIAPNQYRAVAIKIVRFAQAAARVGVALDFDCGFVRCMFSDPELEELGAAGAKVGWRCNPILDVDLAGNILHCFPLAQLGGLPLTAESDATALRRTFEERTRPYRQAGVYKECSSCPLKARGECPGGCLAATIRRFRHTAFRAEVPA
jgi:hypothetical protein